MTTIGDRVLRARLRFNPPVTQEKIATHLGITPQAVNRWEKGKGQPATQRLLSLCRFLRVPEDWLLGGEGPPPPVPEEDIALEPCTPEERLAVNSVLRVMRARQGQVA